MLRREQIIGIVSSWDIRRARSGFSLLFFAGGEDAGYSLLFTDTRLVGARRPEYPEDFLAYLGPGSAASDEVRTAAQTHAGEIIARESFELQRDKIVEIIYSEPKAYTGGRLLFKEVGRPVNLKITLVSPFNPGIISTLETLSRSLFAFAPDRLFDERTGQRITALETLRYH